MSRRNQTPPRHNPTRRQSAPARHESIRHEPVRRESGRRESGRHESGRQESGRQAPSRREPTRSAHDYIMGRSCLEEMLRHRPDRVLHVFLSEAREGARPSDGSRRNSLRAELNRLAISVSEVERRELDLMVSSDSHQGVVAQVSQREFLRFEDLLEMARSMPFIKILALDGVLDPHNLGAILRAAECFGVDAVLWSKNRAAPLGPVVSKVSVGASELVPLCPVSNLHRALESLKEVGVWIVGALVSADATPLDTFEFPERCAVVMGAERDGIQHLIGKSLDFQVYIAMMGEVSSLNVSQASAVMLHAMAKQHSKRNNGDVKVA